MPAGHARAGGARLTGLRIVVLFVLIIGLAVAGSLVCHGASALRPGCVGDTSHGLVLLTGNALGVDAQEHGHAMASPFGDLGWGDSGAEPGGHGGMSQGVRHVQQRRARFLGGECLGASLVEHLEIGPVGDDPAAGASEQPPVGTGAELLQVLTEAA